MHKHIEKHIERHIVRDVNDPESRTLVSFVGFAGSMFYFYCPLPVQVQTSTQKYGETAVQTVRTGIVSHGDAMEPQACPVYSSGGESKPPVFKKFAMKKVTARQKKALRQPLCPKHALAALVCLQVFNMPVLTQYRCLQGTVDPVWSPLNFIL